MKAIDTYTSDEFQPGNSSPERIPITLADYEVDSVEDAVKLIEDLLLKARIRPDNPDILCNSYK